MFFRLDRSNNNNSRGRSGSSSSSCKKVDHYMCLLFMCNAHPTHVYMCVAMQTNAWNSMISIIHFEECLLVPYFFFKKKKRRKNINKLLQIAQGSWVGSERVPMKRKIDCGRCPCCQRFSIWTQKWTCTFP